MIYIKIVVYIFFGLLLINKLYISKILIKLLYMFWFFKSRLIFLFFNLLMFILNVLLVFLEVVVIVLRYII